MLVLPYPARSQFFDDFEQPEQPAPAPEPVPADPDQPRALASGPRLAGAVVDRSVVGTYDDGTSFCEYHAPDHVVLGYDRQGALQGSWRIIGDQICYSYPSRQIVNECYDAALEDGSILYFDQGWAGARGTLFDGNTCSGGLTH